MFPEYLAFLQVREGQRIRRKNVKKVLDKPRGVWYTVAIQLAYANQSAV